MQEWTWPAGPWAGTAAVGRTAARCWVGPHNGPCERRQPSQHDGGRPMPRLKRVLWSTRLHDSVSPESPFTQQARLSRNVRFCRFSSFRVYSRLPHVQTGFSSLFFLFPVSTYAAAASLVSVLRYRFLGIVLDQHLHTIL